MNGKEALAVVELMSCEPFTLCPEIRDYGHDIAVTFWYKDWRWYKQLPLEVFDTKTDLYTWVNDIAAVIRTRPEFKTVQGCADV